MEVWWPHISMREWCRFFVSSKPQLLLAGCTPEQNWMEFFRNFWDDYRLIDRDHPVYSSGYNLGACVPYFVHGDEGRGQNKRPYMVLSWQTVIGHMGIGATNDTSYLVCALAFYMFLKAYMTIYATCHPLLSHDQFYPRHTFTTRWLFSGISSHLYHKDWTIDDLLGEFAKQAIDAFELGVCVPQIH